MINQEKVIPHFTNSISFKIFTIIFLIILLQIPLFYVEHLIKERQDLSRQAQGEIQKRWGGQQYIGSPVMVLKKFSKGYFNTQVKKQHIISASNFKLDAELAAQVRYLGIYETAIYKADVKMSGRIEINSQFNQEILNNTKEYLLFLPLKQIKGIKQLKSLKINGKQIAFKAVFSQVAGLNGLAIQLNKVMDLTKTKILDYSMELSFIGSKEFDVLPQAHKNDVEIRSNWVSPAFVGNLLPDSRRISKKGFIASWHSNNLIQGKEDADKLFGVQIKIPANIYQVNYRTVKYSFLIIVLTFSSFFLTELLFKIQLHPFQYLLIGVSLSVFYLLLLSLSEFFSFNASYSMASVAVILLISGYSSVVLKQRKRGLLTAVLFAVLYGFIFMMVRAEQTSLLMGSLAIWLLLALVMYLTRKIDWYVITDNDG